MGAVTIEGDKKDFVAYKLCRLYSKECRNLAKGDVDVLKIENFSLQLKTLGEIQVVNVEYQFDEDSDIATAKVFMCDKIIEVSGDCTESVFYKLSNILEDRYEIYSCYTCRYGNFCPYGDQDNEIFCINDFEPKCKEDLLAIMADREELEKRHRTLFDVCDKHKPCSNNYWTYK